MAFNLKFRITGDASGVKKATKEASGAVKSFEKESKGALSSLGSALGVNISSIERMGDAFAGAMLKMRGESDQSVEKISKMTGAMKGVGIAAGAMAAAAVAAWKAMSREAEFYGKTLEGVAENASMQTYLDTLGVLRHDNRNGSLFQGMINSGKTAWGEIASYASNLFTSNKFMDFSGAAAQTRDDIRKANIAGVAAWRLKRSQLGGYEESVQVSQMENQIAQLREQMSLTDDVNEKRRLGSQVLDLVNQKTSMQVSRLQEQLQLMQEINAQASDTEQDLAAETQLRIQINNLQAQQAMEQRRINREMSHGAGGSGKGDTQKVVREQRYEIESLADAWRDVAHASDNAAQQTIGAAALVNQALIDERHRVQELTEQFSEGLTSAIQGTFISTFGALGDLIGDALTGSFDDAAKGFGLTLLDTLGGLAVQVGEMAIATGIAISGIKASLESLNPYVAIAAGAALVALGSAVKRASSNLANGAGSGGYSSAYSASASYGGGGVGDYQAREMTVQVTGTIVASGSQLVAVIQSENKRKEHTT